MWARTPSCGPHAGAPLDRCSQASRSHTTVECARAVDQNIYCTAAIVRRRRIGSGATQLLSHAVPAARSSISGSNSPVGFNCSRNRTCLNAAGVDALGNGLPSNLDAATHRLEGRLGPDDGLKSKGPNRKHQWVSQAPGPVLWYLQLLMSCHHHLREAVVQCVRHQGKYAKARLSQQRAATGCLPAGLPLARMPIEHIAQAQESTISEERTRRFSSWDMHTDISR